MSVPVTVDGVSIEASPGWTILDAAQAAEIYIPALCAHPDLPPQDGTPPAEHVHHGDRRVGHESDAEGLPGCGLCVVEIAGRGLHQACSTRVTAGMVVATRSEEIETTRGERLALILEHHPHACLTCAWREGCTREPCSMNVPVEERCCSLLGHCELQAVAEFTGIAPATPRYVPSGTARVRDEALFDRDPDLCIACGRCVRACNLREVRALGWVRDAGGRRWVGPLERTPVESGCRLCGSCVEVCPTGALLDRDVRPAEREDLLVPCRSACPAHTDVPRYVRLVADGRLEEAAAVVAERAPLVEVLGQVCFHPCESACRRNAVNEAPISICRIKREAGRASATAWKKRLPAPLPDTGRRVAVVGAGPAGLVAAQTLRLLGHAVTVFEARASLGGMLAFGIPPFRLSREVVVRETAALADGIDVVLEASVGTREYPIDRLLSDHDAAIVATGAGRGRTLGVPNEDLPGVHDGLQLLDDLATETLPPDMLAGRAVVVVGGGNVAIDCARAARRLEAASVDLVCLESRDDMPAYAEEVDSALEEGVRFHHGWGIRAMAGNGSLAAVELKRCSRVFDDDGRFDPRYDESETSELTGTAAILAIGQKSDPPNLPESREGVVLAGDLATGPGSVVEAIASGRSAALHVDRYLGGAGDLSLRLESSTASPALGRVEGFCSQPRIESDAREHPAPGFLHEIEPGLGPDRARQEADRCLRCDLRLSHRSPPRPPIRETRLPVETASLDQVPESEGVMRFYDDELEVLEIVGGPDMRQLLDERLGGERAATFDFEPCPMYTQRQNEMLSQYMEAHGCMPKGVSEEDDLDDLF